MSQEQKKGGQYPPMHPQQQALYQHQHQQQYPGAPPSYDQAMAHPMPGAVHQPQPQAWQLQMQPGMYANYQQAAAAAASAQNYNQQLQAAAAAGYPGAYAPAQFYSHNPGQYPQQTHTLVMPGVAAYDGSARFNGISQPVVPPAPPGVAPNAAQVAAMQGHKVTLGQKKGNFWTGSSTGGGMTFW